MTAGDGCDEQHAFRWESTRKVQELKLAKARVSALVHGGGEQELESLSAVGRLSVEEEGRIVERGTHGELLAARGLYYELYNSQFRRQV